MNLAVFDFDGTITNKDTLFAFLKFHSGVFEYWFKMSLFIPFLVLYTLRIIPNWRAKERLLSLFINNKSFEDFQDQCNEFSQALLPQLIRPIAMQKLKEHMANNDRILIISASPENWVHPWAESHGIEAIATRLEKVDGKMTGKIEGKNCYGPEKVHRLKQVVHLDAYAKIYAYGDSKGDRELLEISHVPNHKPFR